MAKKTLTTTDDDRTIAALPAWMQDDIGAGTEQLNEYVRPPRIKIIQTQSGDDFSTFWPGDMVAMPQKELIVPVIRDEKSQKPTHYGQPVHFTPLFFWPEWIVVNPIEMRDSLPFIRERTLDPKHELVQLARDPATREFVCPEMAHLPDAQQKNCRRMEVLNFLVMFELEEDHPLHGTPLIMGFAKGDFKTGSNLCSKIRMRKLKGQQAPIFGMRFAVRTRFNPDPKGEWRGFEINNPEDEQPFVTSADQYSLYRDIHQMMVEKHRDSLIITDYDDSDSVEEPVTDM